eukprot:180029_1
MLHQTQMTLNPLQIKCQRCMIHHKLRMMRLNLKRVRRVNANQNKLKPKLKLERIMTRNIHKHVQYLDNGRGRTENGGIPNSSARDVSQMMDHKYKHIKDNFTTLNISLKASVAIEWHQVKCDYCEG